MDAKFNNGDIVRDAVTGYVGMIIATTLWLNGCYRYVVQAQTLDKDGVPVKDVQFDEHQLVRVEDRKHVGKHETGGPRPDVSQSSLTR